MSAKSRQEKSLIHTEICSLEPPTKGLKDHNGAKRLSPLHPTPLQNVHPVRGMEGIEMEPGIPSDFLSLVFPKVMLFHLPSNCPCLLFVPFILLVLLPLPLPFIVTVSLPGGPSHFSLPPDFHSLPEASQFPFVPGTNQPHHCHLVFPALF